MKKLVYALYLLLFVFMFSEISLRYMEFKPGLVSDFSDFRLVDSLYTYNNYSLDEYGIYSFSSWITDSIPDHYDHDTRTFTGQHISKSILLMDNLIHYYYDFYTIDKADSTTSEFAEVYHEILNKKSELNHWENSLYEYVRRPYNSHGFRSIDFKQNESNTPGILVIGDSFVYGMSARPVYQSFCDILLARGYVIYCAGIPGTDPAQYEAIAKRYVKELEPDLVITVFYAGNDFMYFPREAKQSEPHEHFTNAGFFESNPLGEYLNPDEAYNYYKSFVTIPDTDNLFNAFCSKFAVTTLIWKWMYEAGFLKHPIVDEYYSIRNENSSDKIEITSRYLAGIKNVCQANNTPFFMTVIPEKSAEERLNGSIIKVNKDEFKELFTGINFYIPNNLTLRDYAHGNDFHFNNRGALKYADFLDSLINAHLIKPYE